MILILLAAISVIAILDALIETSVEAVVSENKRKIKEWVETVYKKILLKYR